MNVYLNGWTSKHRMITEESKLRKHSPTMLLLEEWGTSGRKRATVNDLFDLLVNVELYQAADFVAEGLLAEAKPNRPPSGPSARYPIIDPDELELQAINSYIEQVDYPNTSAIERNDNRSHVHNRKNSRTDHDVSLVKPMEGIGLSTRDDNPSELGGVESSARSKSNNLGTSIGNSTNGVQMTELAYSTNDAPTSISNVNSNDDNSQLSESEYMPNLADLMSRTVNSSADIIISPMNSINHSDYFDDSRNAIPNLSELLPSLLSNVDNELN